MSFRHLVLYFCAVLLSGLMCAGSLRAQSQAATGQISGVVTDPNGAVVPGAKVTVTSLSTGASRELETNEAGLYQAVLLPPGRYKVTVTAAGFAPATAADVVANVGSAVTVNFALKL